jgi:hypothetical protein
LLNVFKDLNSQLAELAKYKTKIKSERLKSLLTLTGTKGGLYLDTSPVIDEFENMVTWRKMPTGKPIPQPKYGSLQSFDRVDKVVDDIKREMQKHGTAWATKMPSWWPATTRQDSRSRFQMVSKSIKTS